MIILHLIGRIWSVLSVHHRLHFLIRIRVQIVSGVASPRYPPLCSPKAVVADIGTILMQKYVSMDKGSDGQYGTVLSYEEFMDWCKE